VIGTFLRVRPGSAGALTLDNRTATVSQQIFVSQGRALVGKWRCLAGLERDRGDLPDNKWGPTLRTSARGDRNQDPTFSGACPTLASDRLC
jgi:hypothetical protein